MHLPNKWSCFNNDLLLPALEQFYLDIIKPLLDRKLINNEDIIKIMFKVCLEENMVRSISVLHERNIKDFDDFYHIFAPLW